MECTSTGIDGAVTIQTPVKDQIEEVKIYFVKTCNRRFRGDLNIIVDDEEYMLDDSSITIEYEPKE